MSLKSSNGPGTNRVVFHDGSGGSIAERYRAEIAVALEARRNAYAPYSNFPVGAGLRAADGTIFSGANVENASFGLTNCAERSALFAAVSWGHRQFEAIAVATSGGHFPCGACRQALAEFARDLAVILVNADQPEEPRLVQLADLLPGQFVFPAPSRVE